MQVKRPVRKVIDQGTSSTMSLPPAWLRLHHLQPGDWVKVEMTDDGSLLVHPLENKEK